jgi:hypothetical protein
MAQFSKALQTPTQMPGFVICNSREVAEELRWQRQRTEPGDGVPRQIDRIVLNVRDVVENVCVQRQR